MSNEVEIKLNSAQFTKSLKGMKDDVKGFGKTVGKLAVVGVIMKKVADGFKMAYDEILKMNNAARNSGASITTMQSLSNVARKVGEDTGTAAGAIKQLSAGVIEAQDGTGKFADVFRRLGLSAEYMAGLSADQQIFALSDAIKDADAATQEWALGKLGGDIEAFGAGLKLGSDGIRDWSSNTIQFSQESADALESVKNYIIDVKDVIVGVLGTAIAWLIKKFNGIPQAWAQIILTVVEMVGDAANIIVKFFDMDFKGAQRAGDRLRANLVKNAKLIGEAYIDARKEIDEPPKDSGRTVADIERDEKSRKDAEKNAVKSAKEREKSAVDLAKKEAKLAETKSKNAEIGLKPEELRAKLIEDEAAQVDKINKMRGDALDPGAFGVDAGISDAEQGAILDEEDKLAKIKGRIAKIDDKAGKDRIKSIADAAGASAKAFKDAQEADDKANEDALKIENQIAEERDKRSEIGMSDEDLTTKALGEEKTLESDLKKLNADAMEDGKISGEERKSIAEKELELAQKRSEIAGMAEGFESDQDSGASIIASSLAAIGGGGGVAAFSNDPLFNESKKQTSLLGQLVKLQGGTIEGGTTINPEL